MRALSRYSGTALLCLALAACSSGKPAANADTMSAAPTPSTSASPDDSQVDQIRVQALKALLAVDTVKVDMVDKPASEHLAIDNLAGNSVGTISLGDRGSFDFIRKPYAAWLKPDTAFWTSFAGKNGARAAELFKGRYLTGTQTNPQIQDLIKSISLRQIVETTMQSVGTTAGAPTTVDGQKALTLILDQPTGPTTLLVAAEESLSR